jgi:hypothetical protein
MKRDDSRRIGAGSRDRHPFAVHTRSGTYNPRTSGVHFEGLDDPSVPRSPSVKPPAGLALSSALSQVLARPPPDVARPRGRGPRGSKPTVGRVPMVVESPDP